MSEVAEVLRIVKNIEKTSEGTAAIQGEVVLLLQGIFGGVKDLIAVCTKEGDGDLTGALRHLAEAVQVMSGKLDELIVSRH